MVVGCGTGAELREAQGLRPDWALTGVDPAASLLDEARRRLGTAAQQVRWVDSRVEDLPQIETLRDGLAEEDAKKLLFPSTWNAYFSLKMHDFGPHVKD